MESHPNPYYIDIDDARFAALANGKDTPALVHAYNVGVLRYSRGADHDLEAAVTHLHVHLDEVAHATDDWLEPRYRPVELFAPEAVRAAARALLDTLTSRIENALITGTVARSDGADTPAHGADHIQQLQLVFPPLLNCLVTDGGVLATDVEWYASTMEYLLAEWNETNVSLVQARLTLIEAKLGAIHHSIGYHWDWWVNARSSVTARRDEMHSSVDDSEAAECLARSATADDDMNTRLSWLESMLHLRVPRLAATAGELVAPYVEWLDAVTEFFDGAISKGYFTMVQSAIDDVQRQAREGIRPLLRERTPPPDHHAPRTERHVSWATEGTSGT